MEYHPDDFIALSEAVENEGGYIQPDPCQGTEFKLPMRDHANKVRKKRYRTVACGLHARMAIKYDPSEEVTIGNIVHPGEPPRGLAVAPVCAVDDAVGLWPRYANVVTERSFQPE